MYLSSVGSHAPEYFDQIVAWLDAEPSVLLAFQPGSFQIAQGYEPFKDLYRRAHVLICNREEAVEIGGGDHSDVAKSSGVTPSAGSRDRRRHRWTRGCVRI